MGFSISWLAFRGKTKREVLAELRLADTGEPDTYCEGALCGAEIPGGWFLIHINDCFHPWMEDEELAIHSRGCTVLGCQVEEHVMASGSFVWQDGSQVWTVVHESENGIDDLRIIGDAPAQVAAIHADATRAQDEEGGDEADVDMIFDVPIDVAEAVCGFRHDKTIDPECKEPPFTPRYSFTKLMPQSS